MSNVICYSCDYFRKNEELRKENDKLRKHLKTALGTLKKYADKNRWHCSREPIPFRFEGDCEAWRIIPFNKYCEEDGYKLAERTIKKIKARIRK